MITGLVFDVIDIFILDDIGACYRDHLSLEFILGFFLVARVHFLLRGQVLLDGRGLVELRVVWLDSGSEIVDDLEIIADGPALLWPLSNFLEVPEGSRFLLPVQSRRVIHFAVNLVFVIE